MATNEFDKLDPDQFHERRRLRARRKRRRAYIRSIYLLPSMATLGNAACGFAAIYIAGLDQQPADPLTAWFASSRFVIAAYFIFAAMLFDAIDGRLARFTRHTTDFGGQLDSLADAISFGVAPAILMLQLLRTSAGTVPFFAITRAIWAAGAVYMCCAVIRLARFNVSNQHGEQHHFSFLGLPSPAAAGVVASLVLLQQTVVEEWGKLYNHWYQGLNMSELALHGAPAQPLYLVAMMWIGTAVYWALPVITLGAGLLMVSAIRYPHMVNRYLRGKRSMGRLILTGLVLLAVLILHQYLLGVVIMAYVIHGLSSHLRARRLGGLSGEAARTE